ncbi:hypothetical protein CC2G_005786 [Coprinopsis cinerea AmutBmut pab1-1]|nr:hypothetical protein CC2G_005786 [Coprinopsis cinerea AmutBmut pab1-1]
MLRPRPNVLSLQKGFKLASGSPSFHYGFIKRPYLQRLAGCARRNSSKALSFNDLPSHVAPSFSFWPTFLSLSEQKVLLSASLQKLDSMDPVPLRRRRAKVLSKAPKQHSDDLQNIFGPDELYDFHEGHYDGVIHHYREMPLSSWPDAAGLPAILERLHSLCPTKDIQTHLLHLSSYGDILPHVDNIEASGTWIMGVSLGDERVLRMEGAAGDSDRIEAYELLLPSGSVYLQRDAVRYHYKHSIVRKPQNQLGGHGQRLSVMFRDLPTR